MKVRRPLIRYGHRLERMAMHGRPGQIRIAPTSDRPTTAPAPSRIAQIMAIGVVGGWALAFALALPAALCRPPVFRGLAGLSQQVLIVSSNCVFQPRRLAIIVFDTGGPVRGLVALAVWPQSVRIPAQPAAGGLRAARGQLTSVSHRTLSCPITT
jgi:hypothetical protein